MGHGRGRGFAKKIDTVHWTLFQEAALSLSAGAVAFNALGAQHLPETLLRLRGEWAAVLSGASVTGVGVAVVAGLILVPEGTGTTVLWSPISDGDAPWIWWDALQLMYTEQVTDVTWSAVTSSGRRVVDSKAMRKLGIDDAIFGCLEVTEVGAASLSWRVDSRMMFKLA